MITIASFPPAFLVISFPLFFFCFERKRTYRANYIYFFPLWKSSKNCTSMYPSSDLGFPKPVLTFSIGFLCQTVTLFSIKLIGGLYEKYCLSLS